MAHKSGAKGNSRNFGLHGAPGKGSKDRTSDRKKFVENFDEIEWGILYTRDFRITRKKNKVIKTYV